MIRLIIASFCLAFILTAPAQALVTNAPLSAEAQTAVTNQDNAFIAASGLQPVQLSDFVSGIIRIVLSLLGVIFIVLIIYAGLLWMTSAGNEDKIATSKKIMTAGVIGLTIVLAAYAITLFILGQLFKVSSGNGAQPGGGPSGSQTL